MRVGMTLCLAAVLGGCSSPVPAAPGQAELATRQRLEAMAEYAYSTGCYQAYTELCSRLKALGPRDKCFSEGLSACETKAKGFKNFLHSKRDGQPAL